MSTLGRKRRADIWINFTFDVNKNKSQCKPCGATITGKNTTNLKRHLQTHPEIYAKIQNTSKVRSASAFQQDISTALISALKYESDSLEQLAKEEAIARWLVRTGLPVTTIEDDDFVLMMETVDRRLTVPKKAKISNLIEKHYEDQRPSMQLDVLDSLIVKMEELPQDDEDDIAVYPSISEPGHSTGQAEDTGGEKRSTTQNTESQLTSLGERFLAESRREMEEIMSSDQAWRATEEHEQAWQEREALHRTWQQEWQKCQVTMTALTQSLHGNPTSSRSPCGCRSSKPQMKEETLLSPEVRQGEKRGRPLAPSGASSPPGGAPGPAPPRICCVFNRDTGEEEQFLLSLVPVLKRLDNRKKSLIRIKFHQFLYEVEFSIEQNCAVEVK